jgi:lysophospholipase L1-like esterase
MENLLLIPLAIMQGLWVLQRTPRLPAPQGRAGRIGNGTSKSVRVVGIGDSIMAGTGVREQCDSLTAKFARLLHERAGHDVEWRVHGMNGATSAAVLHTFAPRAPAADVYIISAGVNDVTRGVPTEAFAENIRNVYDLLRRKAPQSVIFFGGLPQLECFPALPWPLNSLLAGRARELQHAAATLSARYDRVLCFHFPPVMPAEHFASDGFHPAEIACERWAEGLLDLWLQPALGLRRMPPVVLDDKAVPRSPTRCRPAGKQSRG